MPFDPVSADTRAKLLGHRSPVIWLTGLPGAGKSTIAFGLEQRLLENRILTAVVDGDVLRSGLCSDLGFSAEDRHENVRRAAELALHLAEAGTVAIVALISPFRADRAAAAIRIRQRNIPFAEIFVNAPLAECERRDPKGLYRKARSGVLNTLTGLGSPYESPLAPTLELRTDSEPVSRSIERALQLALQLARDTMSL